MLQYLGSPRHHHATATSTNDLAQALAREGATEGTLVTASQQTAGRGQGGTTWHSPAGQNLMASYILRPHWLPVQQAFGLTAAVALAVAATVRHFAPLTQVHIKWPNDVLADAGKIAGILIETTIAQRLEFAVAGIGINVAQKDFGAAAGAYRLPPASLALLNAATTYAPDEVLDMLTSQLSAQYLRLRTAGLPAVLDAYTSQLYRLNMPAEFATPADGATFAGHITGVLPDGRLKVQTDEGAELLFLHKAVQFQ